VQQSDVQPYFTMAETYTFGDRMFQTNQGPSFPAHQYIISGTSATTEHGIFDAADNPQFNAGLAGCIAPPDAYVSLIETTNPDPNTNETQTAYLL
jgi:phospholipase C